MIRTGYIQGYGGRQHRAAGVAGRQTAYGSGGVVRFGFVNPQLMETLVGSVAKVADTSKEKTSAKKGVAWGALSTAALTVFLMSANPVWQNVREQMNMMRGVPLEQVLEKLPAEVDKPGGPYQLTRKQVKEIIDRMQAESTPQISKAWAEVLVKAGAVQAILTPKQTDRTGEYWLQLVSGEEVQANITQADAETYHDQYGIEMPKLWRWPKLGFFEAGFLSGLIGGPIGVWASRLKEKLRPMDAINKMPPEQRKRIGAFLAGMFVVAHAKGMCNREVGFFTKDDAEQRLDLRQPTAGKGLITKEELKARLMINVAGHVGEEVLLNDNPSVDSYGIHEENSQIARLMVLKLGIGNRENTRFPYIPNIAEMSDAEWEDVNKAAETITKQAYTDAREILKAADPTMMKALWDAFTARPNLSHSEAKAIYDSAQKPPQTPLV